MKLFTLLSLTLAACGPSPELYEIEAPLYQDERPPPRLQERSSCFGSTALTRQQARMHGHRSVEGFSSQTCRTPSPTRELRALDGDESEGVAPKGLLE